MNLNANYKLQAIRMFQCRFINCNKRATLVRAVDNGGIRGGGKDRVIREIPALSAQFCYDSMTAVKTKSSKNCFNNILKSSLVFSFRFSLFGMPII